MKNTFKKLLCIVLAFVMVIPTMAPAAFAITAESTAQLPFTDVKKSAWYYDSVVYAKTNGIIKGISDTEFDPNGVLTRAMFVTLLGRMGYTNTDLYSRVSFKDVDLDSWYGPYVAWAEAKGITYGTDGENFEPHAPVTREQMAAFTHRFLSAYNLSAAGVYDLKYTDTADISEYAVKAVRVMYEIGIMKGDDANSFRPHDTATRAEASATMERLHKHLLYIAQKNQQRGNNDNYETVDSVTFHSVKIAYPANMTENDKKATILPPEQLVVAGDLVYSLPAPYRAGYIFAGWYYDAALSLVASVEDTVTKNITVYPRMVKEDDTSILGDGSLNYVAAIDVDTSYRVTVKAPNADTVLNGISFTGVTDGNVDMPFTVNDNGDGTYTVEPTEGIEAGKTYQLIARDRETLVTVDNPFPADDEYILFIHEGEVQRKEIRYYNIFTYRDEVYNLRIDDDVKFIELSSVSGFAMDDAAGLYTARLSDNGGVTLADNDAEGTFTYTGTPALKVGDVVAIHSGEANHEERTFAEDAEVAYIEITKVEGTTYTYVSAKATDVMFLPEVFPIPYGADLDGDRTNNVIVVESEQLDFSLFEDQEVLNADTVVGVDDFIALYDGVLTEGTNVSYGRIVSLVRGSDTVTLTVETVTAEEIESAIDTYTVNAVDVNIPESEIKDLENKLISQAIESGFAEEAASFYLAERFGIEDAAVGTKYTLTSEQFSQLGIEVDGGNLMYQIEIGRPNVSAEITKNLKKITQINKATGLRVAFGVTIPVGLEVVENGWHVVESLTFDLYVTFEQEVAFNAKFSADAKWKWYFIIPVLKEVTADARFEFGTYTGVGAITTASTEKYYKKTYLWTELVEKEDGTKLFSSASSIATKLNEYLKNGDLSFFGDVGGENELVDKYADMLQREIDYFDILALPIFHKKGYFDPKTHIVNYVIDIELIFAAKLNVTMGISFENLNVKEYSFHFELFKGKKSHNVVDKQTPYTNFNFFLFGNLGVRAGVGLTFTVGLISVKLDNIGVHVQVGPYLELYGFYYYHYDKIGNASANIRSGGAIYVEIGIYMVLDFFAGAFLDLLSVQVHLVDESWKLFGAGTEWYTVEPKVENSTVTTYSGDTFTISDRYFDVLEFNILTGERRTKRVAITDYVLAPSTYSRASSDGSGKITYNEQTGTFEVNAELTDMELTATFEFQYKHGNPLLGPVTKTITINWIKTDPKFAVQYYTGSILYSSPNYWEGRPEVDDSKTITVLAGVPLSKLPDHDRPLAGFDFLGWQIDCPSLPDIHGKMLSDVNYLEGYIMPEANIGLDPIYTPRDDTPYTVRHNLEVIGQPGKYEVIKEEKLYGRTNSSISTFNILHEDGIEFDVTKYPIDTVIQVEHEGKKYNYPIYYFIKHDGSTVIDLYYDREAFTVGIHMNNPVFKTDTDMQKVYYHTLRFGEEIPDPGYSEIESSYYTFKGWSTSPDGPVELDALPETVPAYSEDTVNYYAIWDFEDVDVTINYFVYDPMAKDYPSTPAHTENRVLPIGTKITSRALYPEDETFEAGRLEKYIAYYGGSSDWAITDGYLGCPGLHNGIVINAYYNYNFYQFFFNHKLQYVRAGSEISFPEGPAKPGYVFLGWRSSYIGEEDLLYKAGEKYTAERGEYFLPEYKVADDTAYTVNHYYETETRREYEAPVTQTFYGTTGSKVTPETKGKTGYDSPEAREITILADGSAVVNYYYDRTEYEIKLDLDGGRLNGANTAFYRYGVAFYLFEDSFRITKDAYNFVGWYVKGDESETLLDSTYYRVDGDILTSDSSITFVAKWEKAPITYNVEHYLEQLDGSFVLQQTDTPKGYIDEQVTAVPAEFVGFTCDTDIEGTVASGNIASTSETVTLKLYYTRNSYTATWVDYDGTTELGTATFKFGEEIALPASVAEPTRDTYRFDGWNEFGTMPARNETFSAAEYGSWTSLAGPYDLVLDLGGDSMKYFEYGEIFTYDTDNVTATVGYKEELAQYFEDAAIADFLGKTYPGYTFGGWYDNEGNLYDGDETMPAGNLTLTAKWTPIEVKVTFYSGSNYIHWGDPTGETFTRTYSYGETVDIPSHGFENNGYFISGWKVGNGGGGPGQGSNISDRLVLIDGYLEEHCITEGNESWDIPAGEVFIYPVWVNEDDKCTVTFNANGGTSGSMPDQYIDGSGYNYSAINCNRFTLEGYRFIGWSTEAEYDPEIDPLILDAETFIPGYNQTEITLYAQWEAIQ